MAPNRNGGADRRCLRVFLLPDVVIEGILFVPLGMYSFPAHLGVHDLGGHYYQFSLRSPFIALALAPSSCLRYFRGDRGETVVERADRVRATPEAEVGPLSIFRSQDSVTSRCCGIQFSRCPDWYLGGMTGHGRDESVVLYRPTLR